VKKAKKNQGKPEDQMKAFRKAARELGADKSEERFQSALRAVAKARPHSQEPRERKKKPG
jgi:hypothetical protein